MNRSEDVDVFCDESGITGGPCFGIGAITVPRSMRSAFDDTFHHLHRAHGATGELAWKKIRSSHGPMNLVLEAFSRILRSPHVTFSVIIGHKDQFDLWNAGDRDGAIYRAVTQLLVHRLRYSEATHHVYLDQRSTKYPRHPEVVGLVGNSMAKALGSRGRLNVGEADSKLLPGIQLADVFTGAFTTARAAHLDPELQLSRGKSLLLERMAGVVDWPGLHLGTFPDSKFNVWHFPHSARGVPGSREIRAVRAPVYVKPSDIA